MRKISSKFFRGGNMANQIVEMRHLSLAEKERCAFCQDWVEEGWGHKTGLISHVFHRCCLYQEAMWDRCPACHSPSREPPCFLFPALPAFRIKYPHTEEQKAKAIEHIVELYAFFLTHQPKEREVFSQLMQMEVRLQESRFSPKIDPSKIERFKESLREEISSHLLDAGHAILKIMYQPEPNGILRSALSKAGISLSYDGPPFPLFSKVSIELSEEEIVVEACFRCAGEEEGGFEARLKE